MSPSVEHSRGEEPWNDDPDLFASLYTIVADTAEAGRGARLVVQRGKENFQALISVPDNRLAWRAAADVVLTKGEFATQGDIVGAPADGLPGQRYALLLHVVPGESAALAENLVRAQAARIEKTLVFARIQRASTIGVAEALLRALAAHDAETARHSQAVRGLVHLLADGLALSLPLLIEVERVALLHDVGKIGVPAILLRKDELLTPAEWAVIRQHPATGEGIVHAIPDLGAVAIAIRHHHERWDGTGYPDRLSGEAIPYSARLVALADAYETMRAGRPYRQALSRTDAIAELQRGAGTQFDPSLLPLLPILVARDSLPS